MRRVQLRGHTNILKRLLIHTAGFNLGLLMRQLIGIGTPRSLQGRLVAALGVLFELIRALCQSIPLDWPTRRLISAREAVLIVQYDLTHNGAREMAFVAVGTTVTRRPPHRTVRAGLLHTAPTLDE
jgi:hypothetical protein